MNITDILKQKIEADGPVDMGTFMSLCLSHPEHGYYMTRDPFGVDGDFTTAPEISQLFGEVLGAWAADRWMQLGSPAEFVLLECGPGRGTLMSDLLRATKKVEGFHEAAKIHLMEISPVLKEKQHEALGDYFPVWISALDEIPQDLPVIMIANEFLDALPIRQLRKAKDRWAERVVGLHKGEFILGHKGIFDALVPEGFKQAREGSVLEISPAREAFVKDAESLMRKNGGACVLIDYGHAKTELSDTLQAVKGHEKIEVLEHMGEADLTSHVDFEPLLKLFSERAAIRTQGAFFRMLGVELRATKLGMFNPERKDDVDGQVRRLIGSGKGEMGELFKVLEAFYEVPEEF